MARWIDDVICFVCQNSSASSTWSVIKGQWTCSCGHVVTQAEIKDMQNRADLGK